MYARQITNEQTYTLTEARKIIRAEQLRKREIILNKLGNIALCIICVLSCYFVPYACDGDITASFVFILCAIYFFVKAVKGGNDGL